ncbi:reverse transcriptase domain-containing protein [Tanacetum coccineum]
MEELLQEPTDGVEDAIVVPPILVNQFDLKIGLFNLVTAISFHGFENDDPHSHIQRFTKCTQIVKLNLVPHDIIKLILFLFSLEGAARTWLEKEHPNSITTWNDLMSKFVNQFFPPSRTTNIRMKERDFNKNLVRHQDYLNSAAGGNLLMRNTQEALMIIENKSKVRTSRNKPQDLSANGILAKVLQERPRGALPSNNKPNPREQVNSITTRSGLTTTDPSIPPYVPPTPRVEMEKEPKTLMDEVHITSPASTAHVPPLGIQPVLPAKRKEDPKPNPHQPKISYPLRLNKTKLLDKNDVQVSSFLKILKQLHFDISLMDALTQIPKYHKVLKDLLKDKEKLEELANTPINAECFSIFLNKVPKKLEDPGKFLIPCVLKDLEVCNSLADSGASINLMPLSIYEKLRIEPPKPTRMTLKLANRSVTYPMVSYLLRLVILALLDPFPPRNEDDNFDPKADLREIEYLLNRDPSTDSSPTTNIDIIDLILESLIMRNEESFCMVTLLITLTLKKDKNKDSKAKSLIEELNVLLPRLLDYDSTLHEELPEIDTLPSFPSGNEDKVFNPGILVYGSTHFVTNEVTQDKNLKKKTSSVALLILEELNFLSISSDQGLLFHKELFVTKTLLSFSSENEEKVFKPGILISKGVHSFTLGLSHRTYETFKIINIHLNILNERPMKIFPFFCFCPKDKGIRGEIPFDREDLRACFQSFNHSVSDLLLDYI